MSGTCEIPAGCHTAVGKALLSAQIPQRTAQQFCTQHRAEELLLFSRCLVDSTRLDSRTASSVSPDSRQPGIQGIVIVLELALIVSQGTIRGGC